MLRKTVVRPSPDSPPKTVRRSLGCFSGLLPQPYGGMVEQLMDMCTPVFPCGADTRLVPQTRAVQKTASCCTRELRKAVRYRKRGSICTRTETDAPSQSRPGRSRFRTFRSHLDTQPAPHGILRHFPFPGVSLFGRKRSFLDAFSAVISREPQSTHQLIKCIINQFKASYGQTR